MQDFEYRAQFQGAAQAEGFKPIKAPDPTPLMEKNAQIEQNNMQAMADARLADMKQQEKFRQIYADDNLKKLSAFSETLSKTMVQFATERAKQEYQLGLNDDLRYGVDDVEGKAQYDQEVQELEQGDRNVRAALNSVTAPEEVKQEFRYASGWRGYGQKMSALTLAGQELKPALVEAFETDNETQIPDPLDPTKTFTPVEARSKGSAYVEAVIEVVKGQQGSKHNLTDYHRFMVDKAYNPQARKAVAEVSQNMRALIISDRKDSAKEEAKRDVVSNMLIDTPSMTSLSDSILKYAQEGGTSVSVAREEIIKAVVEAQGNEMITAQQAFNTFNQIHPPTGKPFVQEFAFEIADARRQIRVQKADNETLRMRILKQDADKNAFDTLAEMRSSRASAQDALELGKAHAEKYGLPMNSIFTEYATKEAPEVVDYNERLKDAIADGKAGILTSQRVAEEYPMLKGDPKLTNYIKASDSLNQIPSEKLKEAEDNIEQHVDTVLDIYTAQGKSKQTYSVGLAKMKMKSRLKTLALQLFVETGDIDKALQGAQQAVIGEFTKQNPPDKKTNSSQHGQFTFLGTGHKANFPMFADPTGSQMRSAEEARQELYEIETTAGTFGLDGLKDKEDTLDMWSRSELDALSSKGRNSVSSGLVKIDRYVRAHNKAYPNNVITHDEAIDTLLDTHELPKPERKKDEYEDAARRNNLLQNMIERAGNGGSSQVAVAGGLPPATIRTGFEGTSDVVQAAIHYKMNPAIAPIAGAVYGLESAYGTKPSGQNNFFGIKGQGTVRTTTEGSGTVTQASFKDYATAHESVADFVNLINSNSRYSAVKNAKTPREAVKALKAAGYATDPNYVNKLQNVLTNMGVNLDAPYTNQRLVADSPYSDPSTLGSAACQFVTGNTGTSTGPHVHVGVNKTAGVNSKIDPSPYVNKLFVGNKPLTEVYAMTSGYGPRTHPTRGTYGFHKGIDYATPSGTLITVQGAKTVAKFYDPTGGGNTTACQLPTGEEILLMHGQ